MRLYCNLLAVLLLGQVIASCAKSGPIRRNRSGFRYSKKAKTNPGRFAVIRKKIALLGFFNEAPYGGDDLGVTATEEFRMELSRTGEFIVDPQAVKIFGTSKEIYAGGGVKLAQLARKAKLSGINFVLFGRIIEARVRQKTDEIGFVRETKAHTQSRIEVKVFDVNSTKEIFNQTFNGNIDDQTYKFYASNVEENLSYRQELLRYSVRVATRKAVPSLLEMSAKLDWAGRVARILGNKIYLNAGRESGINIGDVLKIMTEGREIYDPETGALLGMSKGEIKGTLEIIDYFGPDGSVAILHSGGSVTEGDFVQLY